MHILKKITFIFTLLYASYIMFAVVYYYQTSGSKAQSPPSPVCLRGFKNINFHGKCSKLQTMGYKRANFRCFDNSRGEFISRDCLEETVFSKAAYESCGYIAKCPIMSIKPTPYINSPPSILTTNLPDGKLGVNYSATVIAVDNDMDPLTMKIYGLPSGLNQGPCSIVVPGGEYSPEISLMVPTGFPIEGITMCTISGMPRQQGYFNIHIEVTDKQNPPVFKGLRLGVGPFPLPTIVVDPTTIYISPFPTSIYPTGQ